MPSSAIHRFALILALCTLCLVATVALGHAGILPEIERLMIISVVFLSIALAVWVTTADPRMGARVLAWLTAAMAAGLWSTPGLIRAGLGQVLFGLVVGLAVATSPEWRRGPRPVEDEGIPSMRTLGWLTPVCVLAQVLLGAGLRYQALPVWPHVTGSLIVGAILMFAGMAALQSYGFHEPLRRASVAMLWLTGLQLALGMAAYAVRVATQPEAWTVHLTVAHVVTGALTMGAATAFALLVFYHVKETLLVREAAV